MRVLGLNSHRPDAAAALVVDGRIVAAVQEERFTRRRHDSGAPVQTLAWCLEAAGLSLADLDAVAVCGRAPDLPQGVPVHPVLPETAGLHAAFAPSPFARAGVLWLDDAVALAVGAGEALTAVPLAVRPLAPFHTAVTAFLGFRPQSGEYKVMGLAPYGRPRFLEALHAAFDTGTPLTDALGLPPRPGETEPLTDAHADIAASLQALTNRWMADTAARAVAETGQRRLCLSGALALNCVGNAHVRDSGAVDDLWIQPAAGPAGAALGAAFAVARERASGAGDLMQGAFLGPHYDSETAAARLRRLGARLEVLAEPALLAAVAEALAAGQVAGWVQGRMEFGPRALGARSILADARGPAMQCALNESVKFREPFRPFAPAVPREAAAAWFDRAADSPYMLLTMPVRGDPSPIPAATHVDGSARVQTVDAATNPRFHALLTAFGRRTGCPVLVNTSFNVRGEPIVRTPEDAFRCFMGSGLDLLVVETCLLRKADQDPTLARPEHREGFARD